MKLDENELSNRFAKHRKEPPERVWAGVQEQIRRRRRYRLILILLGVPLGLGILLGGYGMLQSRWFEEKGGVTVQKSQDNDGLNDDTRENNIDQSQQSSKENLPENDSRKAQSNDNKDATNSAEAHNDKQEAENQKDTKQAKQVANQSQGNKDNQQGGNKRQKTVASAGRKVPLTHDATLEKMSFKSMKGLLQPFNPKMGDSLILVEVDLPDSLNEDSDKKDSSLENTWQWGLNVLPSLQQFRYRSSGVANEESGIDVIDEAESTGKGILLNGAAYYRLNQHWQLMTGLGYGYQQQDFRHEYKEQTIDTTFIPDTASTGGDNFSGVIDTSYQQKLQASTNRYHRISLPFMVRYRFSDESPWGFFTQTGVRLTYLFSLRSNLLKAGNINNRAKQVENVGNNFINQLNINYRLQLGVQYQLSEEWSLTAAPAFEAQLFSTYDEDYFLKKNSLHYGVSIGVIKEF